MSRRWGNILRRYWVAGLSHFGRATGGKVVLCHDASRFHEDTWFSLLGSWDSSGAEFVTMIPPPQALRKSLTFRWLSRETAWSATLIQLVVLCVKYEEFG